MAVPNELSGAAFSIPTVSDWDAEQRKTRSIQPAGFFCSTKISDLFSHNPYLYT